MKAKLPKKLKGIIPFFEEIEATKYRLDQKVGTSFAAVRNVHSGKRMSQKDFEAAKQLSAMCGKCFGLHLADWFQTNTSHEKFCDWDEYVFNGKKTKFSELQKKLGTSRRIWPTRCYSDGGGALFKVLKRSLPAESHFSSWLACQRQYKNVSNYQRMSLLGYYLERHCGAPSACFGGHDWPDGILPSRVLGVLLLTNYEEV